MFTTLLSRRSLENPTTPLSMPDDWLWDAFGAPRSDSGVRVSRHSALKYSPVWRGVMLIAGDVGKLPLDLFKRSGEGKQKDAAHPAYQLLRFKPNEEMTAFAFKAALTGHAILHGNGYAYIFRRPNGDPEQLIPLLPEKTYPVRENGTLLYVTEVEGEYRKLLRENVLHIKRMGHDGLVGYSLIEYARDSFGLGMAAAKYGSKFFQNAARPSVVVQVPEKLSDKAFKNLKDSWEQMHQGLENHHKVAILEEGATLQPFSVNSRDSQLLETRQFEIREVANWLGVPPHKLGDHARASYNSLEQENQSYLDGLDQWLVPWEEECRDKLLREREKSADTHIVEFNRRALVRADIVARFNAYDIGIRSRIINPNEARAMENMNPYEGGEEYPKPLNLEFPSDEDKKPLDGADTFVAQGSLLAKDVANKMLPLETAKALLMAAFPNVEPTEIDAILSPLESFEPEPPLPPAGVAPQTTDEPEDEGDEDEDERSQRIAATHRELLTDSVRRVVRRLGEKAKRAAGNSKRFPEWLDSFETEHRDVLTEMLFPTIAACAAVIGGDEDGPQAPQLVSDICGSIRSGLDAAMNHPEKEFAGAVEALMLQLESEIPAAVAARVMGDVQ